MDKRWKMNVVSLVSSMMAVMRLQLFCVSSMAMTCHVPAVSTANGCHLRQPMSGGFILMQFIASHLLFNRLIYHAATSQCLKTSRHFSADLSTVQCPFSQSINAAQGNNAARYSLLSTVSPTCLITTTPHNISQILRLHIN